MDNITHSLIGLAAGEALTTARKKDRAPIWFASALANNLPDIDVFFTPLFGQGIAGAKLASMLHHRGFTHTLLMGPLQSIFLLLLLRLLWRKQAAQIPWREVAFVAFLGPWLHILADSWNVYGVHPFWPFDNRWVYGDMIFILEPWIWILLIPPLYGACVGKIPKAFFAFFYFSILAAAWFISYVPLAMAVVLSLGALLMIPVKNLAPMPRILIPLCLFFAFLSGMFLVRDNIRTKIPGGELALSPLPANPFCWFAVDARIDDKTYSAKRILLAPFPGLFPVASCPLLQPTETSAPTVMDASNDSDFSKDLGTFSAPRTELEKIRAHCFGHAMLRFLRAPFWILKEKLWLLGDLRFDREKGVGFAEIEFDPQTTACPRFVPPWVGRFLEN